MSSIFRPRRSFLQNNAWQNSAINALHYPTSQQGSVIPLAYGTVRLQINLIDLNNYRGPTGKKGKTGSIPLAGTSQSGKGGGDSKGKGSKKNKHYSVDVDLALCQGPVGFNASGSVFSSSGVESFGQTQLNFYDGHDGQAPDAHFNLIGYSGTCHVTGTPIDLGQSPVVPNLQFEIIGFLAGVNVGTYYTKDANPADCITDFLTNKRYGAGFPIECLDQLTHSSSRANTYGDYCQSMYLLISTALDGHMKAIEWVNGLMTLTNSTLVWSGKKLKVIPYGDIGTGTTARNGVIWNPDFTAKYDLDDDDFLPWHPHTEGMALTPGEDDPITVTRTNPADADNWLSMEYTDRTNFYSSTVLTAFDQGAIDTYGLRIGDSLPGRAFANQYSAQVSLQTIMQRKVYVRNTGIKFQIGWRFALLEPMDFVTISGRFGDNYLKKYPVRITSIEENDNGDLVITGEDPEAGALPAPLPPGPSPMAVDVVGANGIYVSRGTPTQSPANPPIYYGFPYGDPIYGWGASHPEDSPYGTLSVWIKIHPDNPPPSQPMPIIENNTGNGITFADVAGDQYHNYLDGGYLYRTQPPGPYNFQNEMGIFIYGHKDVNRHSGGLIVWFPSANFDPFTGEPINPIGSFQPFIAYQSGNYSIPFDNEWHHIFCHWNLPDFHFYRDGASYGNWIDIRGYFDIFGTWQVRNPAGSTIRYSELAGVKFYTGDPFGVLGGEFHGCTQDLFFCPFSTINNPKPFRTPDGRAKDLGKRAENAIALEPFKREIFLHYPATGNKDPNQPGIGQSYYGYNRAGFQPDNYLYWADRLGIVWYQATGGDPEFPNLGVEGSSLKICNDDPY